jgi:hypothetical protein
VTELLLRWTELPLPTTLTVWTADDDVPASADDVPTATSAPAVISTAALRSMDLRMNLPRYLRLSPVGKATAAEVSGKEKVA